MQHRTIAALIAASLLISSVPALASSFTDVPDGAWFTNYVELAASYGIVSGYTDAQGRLTGRFGPADNVTMEQSLKIALESAGYDEMRYQPAGAGWSARYYGVAVAEGIFPGGCNRCSEAQDNATRGEVAQIIADAFKVEQVSPQDNPFLDVSLSHSYAFAIGALSRDGVVTGDTRADGSATGAFRPDAPINRAETVKMVLRARDVYGTPGAGSVPDDSGQQSGSVPLVTFNGTVFIPSEIHIKLGQAVEIRNASEVQVLVSSDPHPIHTNEPGLNASAVIRKGESYLAQFSKVGTYGYHNHLNASQKGTIIVEP